MLVANKPPAIASAFAKQLLRGFLISLRNERNNCTLVVFDLQLLTYTLHELHRQRGISTIKEKKRRALSMSSLRR
jgi:hypothetical protein